MNIFNHSIKKIKNLNVHFNHKRAEKKLYLEIPKLIDVLISYMNAGLHPHKSLELSSQKLIFSKNIRFPLCKIINLCARGCTFTDSIDSVLFDTQKIPSRKNLSLLLIGLKISFLKGVRSVNILEKIKEKTIDEIQFQRKLKVLTAQMRLQAMVILFSPLILGFLVFLIAPQHIYIFFESIYGNLLLICMIFLNICGYFTINKLLKIK